VSSEKGRGSEFYFLIINMLPDENLVSEDFVSENEIMMKENNFDKISEFLGKKRFKS
jgi:hypothetical protein